MPAIEIGAHPPLPEQRGLQLENAKALQAKAKASPLTRDVADQKPVYSVITNCTYDGLCYDAVKVQNLLEQSCDRIHFDEAWYQRELGKRTRLHLWVPSPDRSR